MDTPKLTATEAVLAAAAATTPEEMHAARLALIATGSAVTRNLDRSHMVAGTGLAGRRLLGIGGSCARRTTVLQARLRNDLATADRPAVDLTNLPIGGTR